MPKRIQRKRTISVVLWDLWRTRKITSSSGSGARIDQELNAIQIRLTALGECAMRAITGGSTPTVAPIENRDCERGVIGAIVIRTGPIDPSELIISASDMGSTKIATRRWWRTKTDNALFVSSAQSYISTTITLLELSEGFFASAAMEACLG
jgi:hypothetical protein